ncbi:hypothetical protein V8C42DRAFT_315043 [Trichoderma barbatum]
MAHIETNSSPNRDSTNIQADGVPYHLPATEYATAWACLWTDAEFGVLNEHDLALLKHVNCSYFSSGRPPTLLALKQHAQSLTNLIKRLCISNTFGIINGKGERRPAFKKDEAFDWLNDLDKPYTNNDEVHHIPLEVLANQVKKEDEDTGIECHCPLKVARSWGTLQPGEIYRPYSSHHNLLMHANTCLEILDHEYGATGGLASLLPSGNEDDSDQMSAARNTILGQLLLHQQHMVARMHELEIFYAKALDTLSGEAVVPMQMLQRLGADGRAKGRELVYPQDRFILANAGDDVFILVHRLMDEEESKMQGKEKVWWESGVSGERMWSKISDGKWHSRGLVTVDLMTRFVRVKDQGGRSTIFIMPAIKQHPGTAQTHMMENQPTVVSVVAPSWPERASDLEQRVNIHLQRVSELEDENRILIRDKMEMKAGLDIALAELYKTKQAVGFYEGTSDGATRGKILIENATMRRQMAKLRKVLPQRYHRLLRAEE